MDAYLTHPKLSVTDIFLAVNAASHDGAPLISLDRKLISQLGADAPRRAACPLSTGPARRLAAPGADSCYYSFIPVRWRLRQSCWSTLSPPPAPT